MRRAGSVLHMALNNVDVRFVEVADGRGYGLGGLDLKVATAIMCLPRPKSAAAYVSDDEVHVCGVRFRLLDP